MVALLGDDHDERVALYKWVFYDNEVSPSVRICGMGIIGMGIIGGKAGDRVRAETVGQSVVSRLARSGQCTTGRRHVLLGIVAPDARTALVDVHTSYVQTNQVGFIGEREELPAAKEASQRVGFLNQPSQQASTVGDDGYESDESTKGNNNNWV